MIVSAGSGRSSPVRRRRPFLSVGRTLDNKKRLAKFCLASIAAVGFFAGARAEATDIRTSSGNVVPQCVTPERLMAFLRSGNDRFDPRYKDLAKLYKSHGERWNVRWDYAFFQMMIETGSLTFTGDVRPAQNNFAGLGTTGGGVPGDSYPNVSTGVLAQIQHLVAYSGERVPNPVGARTQLKQDDIVAVSAKLKRSVRFADLARRWAVDPKYGRSIEGVAERFRQIYCAGRDAADAQPAAHGAPRSGLGGEPALVRKGTAPIAQTDAGIGATVLPKAIRATGGSAVRTVWSRAKDGDVPPQRVARLDTIDAPPSHIPRDGGARVESVVAASDTARPTGTIITPIDSAPPSGPHPSTSYSLTSSPVVLPVGPRPVETAKSASPAVSMSEPHGATIAMSSAAAPFAAAQVVAEAKGAHGSCRIVMASYGGTRTVLIRSSTHVAVELIVLSVIPGFERYMTSNYIRTRAPRGVMDGEFADRDQALVRAKQICPEAT